MGTSNSREKHSSKSSKSSKRQSHKASEKMKDDYVKFIMREQERREKEFKTKVQEKDNIYNQVA